MTWNYKPSWVMFHDNRSKAVFVEEKHSKYHAENPAKWTLVGCRIDGVALKDGVKKCDNALYIPDKNAVCFIELKGSDLKQAVRQITSTLELLNDTLGSCAVHARVVLSRVSRPDMASSDEIRLRQALARRRGKLKYESRILEEDIEKEF